MITASLFLRDLRHYLLTNDRWIRLCIIFCELIHMAPLDRDAALDLITEPMKSIGIEYHDKADREVILEYTACHPNLLQFYGKYLIEKIGKHRRVED